MFYFPYSVMFYFPLARPSNTQLVPRAIQGIYNISLKKKNNNNTHPTQLPQFATLL